MATNDYKAFACSPGSNVLTQAQWLAYSQMGPGFQSGVAPSAAFNKLFRQSSQWAAAAAQLACDRLNADVLDTGSPDNLKQLMSQGEAVGSYASDTGSTNAVQVAYPVTFTTAVDGMKVRFRCANSNTGAVTFAPNGMIPSSVVNGFGVALTGGEMLQNGIYEVVWNSVLAAWVLQNPAVSSAPLGGAASVPGGLSFSAGTIYSVASLTMPKTGRIAVSANGGLLTANPLSANTFGGLILSVVRGTERICASDITITMNTGDGIVLAVTASNNYFFVNQGDILTMQYQIVIGRGDISTMWLTGVPSGSPHASELSYHYIK